MSRKSPALQSFLQLGRLLYRAASTEKNHGSMTYVYNVICLLSSTDLKKIIIYNANLAVEKLFQVDSNKI